PGNAFRQMEAEMARQVVRSLDAWRDWRDKTTERLFLGIYGQPALQALAGLPAGEAPRRRPALEPEHQSFLARRTEELRAAIAVGGPREAALRAIAYVALAERVADERGFAQLRRLLEEEGGGRSLADFKQGFREQFFMLLLDPEQALLTLPRLLDGTAPEEIQRRLEEVRRITTAGGPLSAHGAARLASIEAIFARAHTGQKEEGSAARATDAVRSIAQSATAEARLPPAEGRLPGRLA
ncbi:DUF3141 domain-containing protein, partial [Roseomonas chloroacetimidivorans]|uniref:DUF3141 domain-containing protein n=1 Tax=Roseomonas chloroacetimidivorans TaxID=1766656 RepID=UPI003C763EEE